MKQYVVTSSHPVDLVGGQVVAAGASFKLSEKEAGLPHVEALIDSGAIREIREAPSRTRRKKPTSNEGGDE